MRVLYLFSSAETSVAIVTLNQIKALKKNYQQLDIRIACVNYYKENSILEKEIFYYKNYNSNQIVNCLQSLWFIWKIKKNFNPDITISNMSSVNSYNALINKNDYKIGIFHAPAKQLDKRNLLTKYFTKFSIKYIFSKLNCIIGISQEIVDDLKNRNIDTEIKLFHNIHNVERIIRKSAESFDDSKIKEKHSVEILCLGTIDSNKRQDILIESLVNSRDKNIKLYIVGKIVDKNYYQRLKKMIADNKLDENVIFFPFLKNPYPLIKRVDMVMSMSESEGLPGVIIESLILNTPVICSNSSKGVWEILNEIKNYRDALDYIHFAKKGLILPSPINFKDKLPKLINDSIDHIIKNKDKMQAENFDFLELISENSIHSFYELLKEVSNENNN